MSNNWKLNIPVYVTRKDNDGACGTWSVGAGGGVAILVLAQINAVVWGVLGLYFAVRVFV